MELPDPASLATSERDTEAVLALIPGIGDDHTSSIDDDDTLTTIARLDGAERVRVHQARPWTVLGVERVDDSLTAEAACALVAAVCGRELLDARPPPWLVDLASGRAFLLAAAEVDARVRLPRQAALLIRALRRSRSQGTVRLVLAERGGHTVS